DQIGLEKITQSVQDFVKRFPGWKSRIDGRIRELQEIAKSIDTFHRGSTIANVTASSVSAGGGVLAVVGIIAAPFTAGTSLVLTVAGATMGAAGAATNLTADISEYATRSARQKKVDEIIEQNTSDMKEMSQCLKNALSELERLDQCNDVEVTELDYSEGHLSKVLGAGSKIPAARSIINKTVGVKNAVVAKQMIKKCPEIKELAKKLTALSRKVRNTKYATQTKSVTQMLSGTPLAVSKTTRVATGVLSAAFVVWDIYSITTSSIDLHKGCKTEVAKKIEDKAHEIENALSAYEDMYQEFKTILKGD
ncbi:apolipoprotein L3-like, partial [Scyliorhinus torazame]